MIELNTHIENHGFYGRNNVWNSLIMIKGKPYRHRVETLVIKDNKYIFLKLNSKYGLYIVPGGSIEKDIDNVIQAENEVNEEARMVVANVRYTNITYTELYEGTPKTTMENGDIFNYMGKFSEVYIADYKGRYTEKIPSILADNRMANDGRFYKIQDVFHLLKSAHKKALIKHKLIKEMKI